MIVFSDLHLKESTADICWEVLERIEEMALEDDPDRRIIFCGDFWQLRYQVSVRLLNTVRDTFDRWLDAGLQVDLVPGNHDQVTVEGRNALEVLERDGVKVWTEPGIGRVFASGAMAGFVPYRKSQPDQTAALKETLGQLRQEGQRFPVVFGHFAIQGAKMNNGHRDQDGLALPQGQDRYLLVLGHYHKSQWVNGVEGARAVYVGSPYQQSFGEAGNSAGVGQILWADDETGWSYTPHSLDIGPRHYVVTWDLAKRDRPPDPRSLVSGVPGPNDRVRMDIVAPSSQVTPELMETLKASGYETAQVNVQPVSETRETRFGVEPGESLAQAAERFVGQREPDNAEAVIAKLRQWAGVA